MTRVFSVSIALMLVAACDAQDPAAAAKGDKTPSKADTAAPAAGDAAPTKDAAPVKFAGLADCLQSCEAGDVIPTNRETCKLNCDTVYGAQPAAATGSGSDPVGQAASCFGRCYAADTATADCANSCKTAAASATPTAAPEVIDRLGACIGTCQADKNALPTNRATCELNCTQAARVAGPAPQAGQAAATK